MPLLPIGFQIGDHCARSWPVCARQPLLAAGQILKPATFSYRFI
jgi:hypothetical protein